MKQGLSMHAAGLGLVLATTSAWSGEIAQIPSGSRSNGAAIEQIASDGSNLMLVRQGDNYHYNIRNRARLEQSAVDNSVIDVFQWNHANQANVVQHDGTDLQVRINPDTQGLNGFSDENIVNVDQSGNGAHARVFQDGMYVHADVVQLGWGGGNVASIAQSGFSQQATIFQAGGGWSATIVQPDYNSNNIAIVRQGSDAAPGWFGNSSVRVRQGDESRGSFENKAYLTQQAVSNSSIDVFQYDFNNQADVHQHDGSDLHATVNAEPDVYGERSESNALAIGQSGHGARARVEQGGIMSRADIVQEGWSNLAAIYQTGDFHQATITQSGGGFSATIVQSGNVNSGGSMAGNTAVIRQSY